MYIYIYVCTYVYIYIYISHIIRGIGSKSQIQWAFDSGRLLQSPLCCSSTSLSSPGLQTLVVHILTEQLLPATCPVPWWDRSDRDCITSWWFGTFFIFHILGIIITRDSQRNFSEKLKPPTRLQLGYFAFLFWREDKPLNQPLDSMDLAAADAMG